MMISRVQEMDMNIYLLIGNIRVYFEKQYENLLTLYVTMSLNSNPLKLLVN
jgi:hypothetical protein